MGAWYGRRHPRQLPLLAKASFTVDAEGVITVKRGMTDIGTGTYTVLAQIAAETLGVPWATCASRSAT
jgi:CO/xanthine dehydrogenase Mo-binding subunit